MIVVRFGCCSATSLPRRSAVFSVVAVWAEVDVEMGEAAAEHVGRR